MFLNKIYKKISGLGEIKQPIDYWNFLSNVFYFIILLYLIIIKFVFYLFFFKKKF